jgi:Domain of unknown function (DUF4878)
MKKTTFYLLFTLFFAACGNGNSPKGVALTFLTNMSKMNYPEAKKFATPQTQQYIDKMGAFGGKMGRDDDYSPIIILRDSIMNDKAWVLYKTEKNPNEEYLDLMKIEGKWKVNLKMKK